eukprot:5625439-Prorocentrum_lima.AAC.1
MDGTWDHIFTGTPALRPTRVVCVTTSGNDGDVVKRVLTWLQGGCRAGNTHSRGGLGRGCICPDYAG